MKVVDLADEIYREIGSPSDYSVASIAFWARTNIGTLNNLLDTEYVIDGAFEIVDEDSAELSIEAGSIMKCLYRIHYYTKKFDSQIVSITNSDLLEMVSDDGTTIRRVNKNEVSKTILQAKKSEEELLKRLVLAFKTSSVEPLQVAGDDTLIGRYTSNTNSYLRNDENA